MAADDIKRTECVKVCFTERELLDLNRLAIREDRKLADMVRVMARRVMYGMVKTDADQSES
jgi:hypothetical protein